MKVRTRGKRNTRVCQISYQGETLVIQLWFIYIGEVEPPSLFLVLMNCTNFLHASQNCVLEVGEVTNYAC